MHVSRGVEGGGGKGGQHETDALTRQARVLLVRATRHSGAESCDLAQNAWRLPPSPPLTHIFDPL